ncbi:hypothetical protein K0M31_019157 [Melipona bicolor]|uniref:Uncharacterized protein n=1 Tax=Melipona bicolor TaxID=60889 RepID=A0AA40G283_9HYME|nr:hypothetical protein K0M31_019157 [Melipona bicolor]
MSTRLARQKKNGGILMLSRASLLRRITILVETPLCHPLYFLYTHLQLSVPLQRMQPTKEGEKISTNPQFATFTSISSTRTRGDPSRDPSRMEHHVEEFLFLPLMKTMSQDKIFFGPNENLW